MNQRLSRAEAIFHAVADAPPERRESLLAEWCAGDTVLRALVERLLAHDHGGMHGFLHPPARVTETSPMSARPDRPGTWIGPYEVLDVIAEGGMGTVYVARQHKPVERDVALKLIRAGMDSKLVIARFEAERQALAMMDHPNIARVLDAGETEQGLPYVVMELIRGVPITDYCDGHRLTTRERLELFRPVCEAVQHAHQKAVIHRDLKPSNVLVSEVGNRPMPRIIDFGVAKATARRLAERPMLTEPGVLIGTLEYMSPEQANPTSDDVDTRTDVYSLGAILYQLLTGELPFDVKDTRGGGNEGILRRIREEDPKRPSTRFSVVDARATECANWRGTEVPTLRRQLRGDLDWIVMKALEKDRARRYASPMELAADIHRHLKDEPVEAQPPSASYRAGKFVLRHRLGVAAAVLVTLAVAAAVVGTSVGLIRARQAEARARAEQQRSEKAAAFLANTLNGIDPAGMGQTLASTLRDQLAGLERAPRGPASGSDTPAPDPFYAGVNLIDVARSLVDDEILGKAVQRIDRELTQDPALAADLYRAIGNAYDRLQLFQAAVECAEHAVELSERAHGRDDTTAVNMRIWLANAYAGQGRYRDAEKVYREAIESSRRTQGEDARATLIALGSLGWNYQQEGQAARTPGADRGRRRHHGAAEAVPLLRSTLERMRRIIGQDDPYTLWVAHGLGLALRDQARFDEAEALLRDTIARMTRVQGPGSPESINAGISLASVLYLSGRFKEGEAMVLELLDRSRRAVGNDGFLPLLIELKLGVAYLNQGRYDKAEGLLRNCAEKLPRVLGEQSQFTQQALHAVGRLDSLQSHRPSPTVSSP